MKVKIKKRPVTNRCRHELEIAILRCCLTPKRLMPITYCVKMDAHKTKKHIAYLEEHNLLHVERNIREIRRGKVTKTLIKAVYVTTKQGAEVLRQWDNIENFF